MEQDEVKRQTKWFEKRRKKTRCERRETKRHQVDWNQGKRKTEKSLGKEDDEIQIRQKQNNAIKKIKSQWETDRVFEAARQTKPDTGKGKMQMNWKGEKSRKSCRSQ